MARHVQAILRRGGPAAGQVAASYGGGRVELTPTEWGILVALATVPGRVYSRYELINRVRAY